METKPLSKDEQRFTCVALVCVDFLQLPLIDILDNKIKPPDLFNKISACSKLVNGKQLTLEQRKLCFLKPPNIPDYTKFDITLLYKLLRNLCSSLTPQQDWGKEPKVNDMAIVHDIERLRMFRNGFAHASSSEFTEDKFENNWKDLKSVIQRIQSFTSSIGCKTNYIDRLKKIKTREFGYDDLEKYKLCVKSILRSDQPEISIKGDREIEVLCGDKASFEVELQQADLTHWTITWRKVIGTRIEQINTSTSRYSDSTDRQLVIHSVCKEDKGNYQAVLSEKVSNGKSVLQVVSNVIFLHTLGEPPFRPELNVTNGREDIFIHYQYQIPVRSPKVCMVQWFKNGEKLNLMNEKYLGGGLDDDCLTIKSTTTNDQGIYCCTVSNAVGSESQELKLDVPNASICKERTVYCGSSTELRAQVSSCPSPDEVKWQRSSDGNSFNFIDIDDPEYFGSRNDILSPLLRIPKATHDVQLYYRLFLRNKLGENISNTIYLNITGSAPNIMVSHDVCFQKHCVKLIGKVYLYSGKLPAIQDVFWTKDGAKLDIQGSGGKYSEVGVDDSSLMIYNVNHHDIGTYQLTATNAVGSTKSDVIVLGKPQIVLERTERKEDGRCWFTMTITAIPEPIVIQWSMKENNEKAFELLNINDAEYKGTTDTFPHPVLVVKSSKFEKYKFQIEVKNFIGNSAFIIHGEKHHKIPKSDNCIDGFGKFYINGGANVKFSDISNEIAENFPNEKMKELKEIIQDLDSIKVEDITSLKQAATPREILRVLKNNKLFTPSDVICMQFLLNRTDCQDLFTKCIKYAEQQNALCFYEKPPENGVQLAEFHVRGNLSDYSKEQIEKIKETVASIVGCTPEEIHENGYLKSSSFWMVLSMKEPFARKLLNMKHDEKDSLRRFNIDYIKLNNDIVNLEISKDHSARGYLAAEDTSPIMSSYMNVLVPKTKAEIKETKIYRPGLRKMENSWEMFQGNNIEILQELYRGKGYTFTAYPADCYSFYYCLMEEMDRKPLNQRKAREIQSDLFEFQMKNPMYYHLFLPQCVTYDDLLSSNDCLQLEFKKIINAKKPPTPREVYAAAEMLQRYICVIRFDRSVGSDIQELQGYIFAPTSKENLHMEPLCLLMLVKADGVVEFGRIGRKDKIKDLKSCPGQIVNLDHKHCFGLRFVNDFSVLFDRKVAYGEMSDVRELFRRLSLEFYGTEIHHRRILNIICNFELEEDNLELFCKYADNTITDETSLDDKKERLKTHVKEVKKRQKAAGEGELFAVSSVFNIDMIIDITGRDEWETYTSVVCCYLSCFDSPIILRVKGRDNKLYIPYVTESYTCSCRQQKPQIQGHIGKVRGNIHEAVLKHPCCPPEIQKGNHTHLRHIPNIRSCWPPKTEYIIPAEFMAMVISRLEIEDRCIDQINGGVGSLAKAMAKELYGDENGYLASGLQFAMGREDIDHDVKLRQLSNWLKVPIFIYMYQKKIDDGHSKFNVSQRFIWTKFEPDLSTTVVSRDCRFYITLFYNHLNGTFDRIIPLRGCNCQIPAPLSFLRNSQNMETQFLPCVYPDDRHHPLPTFLTTDPERNKFDMEIRDFPACSAFSSVRIAMQRNDMRKRTIDCVEINHHSLLRCLSKEIFGTEKQVDLLMEELCNEFSNNVESYIHFLGRKIIKAYEESGEKIQNNGASNKKLAKFVKERIEDDLPCDDLLLMLACTFFQTTIFVLRVTDTNTLTESLWTDYAMVRKRRKDPTKRTSFSRRCPKAKTYYITLFESGSKQYYRIVPKQASCNCALDAPAVSDHNADATEYHTFQDCKLMRKIRKIDSLLNSACTLIDQWLICNQILQRNCELIILKIEGRRKNVNIATIAGTGTGIVGAVLTGIGILFAPATGGLSTLLSAWGAVMAVSGGTVATGAKITESVLNNGTIDKLKRYQNCYKERFDNLKSVIREINNEMKELSELSREIQANQNIDSSDFADVQSIPGIVRAVKGLIMIPISLLKVSARGITILGAIIGPLSALIDASLLIFSAKNMAEGNKTDVTENLRRISAALYGSRRQMHSWAYGNQRPYHYN